MNRERARAEQFDEALERLRGGDPVVTGDEELNELLDLAMRLERELTPDLPDPAFRDRLKKQLIEAAEPSEADRPVDLVAERKRRRTFGYWSYGAAAAVLAAVLVVGIVAGWDRLMGHEAPGSAGPAPMAYETGGGETSKTEAEEAREDDAQRLLRSADEPVEIPPFDAQHIVQPPFGYGSGGTQEAAEEPTTVAPSAAPASTVTWLLASEPPDLPATAQVYHLEAPADPITFLETRMARLGIDGTIQEPGVHDPQVYVALNETADPVMTWSPERAHFSYDMIGEPTAEPAKGANGDDPVGTARRWLEEIGFDLHSIEYVGAATSGPDITTVRFRPSNLPASGFDLQIAMEVGIASDGTVRFAHGHWFSLIGSEEAPLRSGTEAWQELQAGRGVWVPSEQPIGSGDAQVNGAKLTYVLLRGTEGSYLLQPAVEFRSQFGVMGEQASPSGPSIPGTGPNETKRVYVSALE